MREASLTTRGSAVAAVEPRSKYLSILSSMFLDKYKIKPMSADPRRAWASKTRANRAGEPLPCPRGTALHTLRAASLVRSIASFDSCWPNYGL